MKSIFTFITGAVLLAASGANAANRAFLGPRTQYKTLTYEGCYSSSSGLSYNTSYQFNTKGYCQTQCVPAGFTVQATTNSQDCWCGDSVPDASAKVDDSFCNDACAGYGTEMCGSSGSKYFSVYLTGLNDASVSAGADSSSTTPAASTNSPSSTLSTKPSVITVGGQTVVVTAAGSPTASASSSSSSGPNKAGIAAGVVVGLAALCAIIGGFFLFIRNKKRRDIEEEYKRNAAVSNFIAGGKPPQSSSGTSSFTDTRLDPVMAQRRMSDGSIADNQDYSRRILKVTNA